MKAIEEKRVLFGILIFTICMFSNSYKELLANGEQGSFTWGQWEDGENLAGVKRYYRKYEDTGGETCYGGAGWCCKTSTPPAQNLPHWHLDTDINGDLTSTEKTRANNWWEENYAWASSTNRKSNASAFTNCHGWALDRDSVFLSDNSTILDKDYTPKSLGQLQEGDVCDYSGNHTSKITELDGPPCNQTIEKVEGKFGGFGRYETGPSETYYGSPIGYYRKK